MRFKIELDNGTSIRGWCAPDDANAPPQFLLTVDDTVRLVFEGTIHRPDLVELGHHATGVVGFEINETHMPDLGRYESLEIREIDSGLLIYRRLNGPHKINKSVMMFDGKTIPQIELWRSLRSPFALSYNSIERLSEATVFGLIQSGYDSMLLRGRINFEKHKVALKASGFFVTAVVSDPLIDLAERLLFLKAVQKSSAAHQINSLAADLMPLSELARNISLDEPERLSNIFRQTTRDQRDCLRSPITKMYGALEDEIPKEKHVGIALQNLSTCDLVGTYERFAGYRRGLNEALDVELLQNDDLPNFKAAHDLATQLSQVALVGGLLEYDVKLYTAVDEAVAAGLAHRQIAAN